MAIGQFFTSEFGKSTHCLETSLKDDKGMGHGFSENLDTALAVFLAPR